MLEKTGGLVVLGMIVVCAYPGLCKWRLACRCAQARLRFQKEHPDAIICLVSTSTIWWQYAAGILLAGLACGSVLAHFLHCFVCPLECHGEEELILGGIGLTALLWGMRKTCFVKSQIVCTAEEFLYETDGARFEDLQESSFTNEISSALILRNGKIIRVSYRARLFIKYLWKQWKTEMESKRAANP